LLDDLGKVRDRRGWQKCLEDHCAELKGPGSTPVCV
jgi:hypothetical protein